MNLFLVSLPSPLFSKATCICKIIFPLLFNMTCQSLWSDSCSSDVCTSLYLRLVVLLIEFKRIQSHSEKCLLNGWKICSACLPSGYIMHASQPINHHPASTPITFTTLLNGRIKMKARLHFYGVSTATFRNTDRLDTRIETFVIFFFSFSRRVKRLKKKQCLMFALSIWLVLDNHAGEAGGTRL